jgi:hypothetical protein
MKDVRQKLCARFLELQSIRNCITHCIQQKSGASPYGQTYYSKKYKDYIAEYKDYIRILKIQLKKYQNLQIVSKKCL